MTDRNASLEGTSSDSNLRIKIEDDMNSTVEELIDQTPEIVEASNNDLESLGVKFVEQDSLEKEITKKADAALSAKDDEQDQKRLEKAKKLQNRVLNSIRKLESQLRSTSKLSEKARLKKDVQWLVENDLQNVNSDISDIEGRIKERADDSKGDLVENPSEQLSGESRRDFLIRTGKITAFGNESAFFQDTDNAETVTSHRFLRAPGFGDVEDDNENVEADDYVEPKEEEYTDTEELKSPLKKRRRNDVDEDDYEAEAIEDENENDDDEFVVEDDEDIITTQKRGKKSNYEKMKFSESKRTKKDTNDDGDELYYQKRLRSWVEKRSDLRHKNKPEGEDETVQEWYKPHPTIPDAVLNDEFRIPGDIYPSLFDYQKTCVQWLWELYSQKTGGIIGDEMGLGKTVQMISFLAGLHYSGKLTKPIIVVCPATVMKQWVNEFHRWWPPMRTVILHNIGSGMSGTVDESKLEEMLELQDPDSASKSISSMKTQANAEKIINTVMEKGHVLVTTYVGLRIYSKYLLSKEWGYAVLDEGHKIRNPNSDISLTAKQLKTHNRIILSGTPIQNNLTELWSLFDFVFPGRLGTLPVFQTQFAEPINVGGYASASNVQVQTGYKCAVVLRDLISPYLLRRVKSDVAQDLPKKNEMVLFCKLTTFQQEKYEQYINSSEITSILKGKRNVLLGVDMLRKICNHPDLTEREILMYKKDYNYGAPGKSGKMQVVKALLELWKNEGHRTLLFTQTRQMLDILQKFVSRLDGFNYLRMDGSTPIAQRQSLVDTFNEDNSFHVFLLTTKVGGLGINLTGADRVIIYDPDWNPSTDVQARERAWRLGQKKDVTIYRLMTAGSIEEKIYHRQIFKQFLTNKILKDPKQRRFFKMNDLHDLFTLGDPDERGTETGDMFDGTEHNFNGTKDRRSKKLGGGRSNDRGDDDFYQVAELSGVSKLSKFENEQENDGFLDEGDAKETDESRIMEGLFARTGVHSALEHDAIMDSSKHEVALVEKEASKIAADAARALQRSRKAARSNAIGTPTWTGKFGLAGKFGPSPSKSASPSPGPRKVIGNTSSTPLSSTSILEQIRQKKEMDAKKNSSRIFGAVKKADVESSDKEEMIQKLRDFLSKRTENFAKSSDVLIGLNLKLTNQKEMVTIRSMLREIADWDSTRKGWKLKESFV